MTQITHSNSTTPDDIIRALCAVEGDTIGVNFMKYKGVALDVWRELNLWAIRYTKRVWLPVDSRTNTIALPCDYLHFSSLSVLDECGKLKPLYFNTSITSGIIDIETSKKCSCEHECGSTLCNQIKGYEAIAEELTEDMPDGSTKKFTALVRKRLNSDGSMIIERTYPVRIYTGNPQVWTGVELRSEIEHLCKLEVDENGCALDTPENHDKVACHCAGVSFEAECGGMCPIDDPDTFGLSEQDGRLALPSTVRTDKVLLRYYVEEDGASYRVPYIAKKAFISGLKDATYKFEPRATEGKIRFWEREAAKNRKTLTNLLNRYSINEYYSIALTPKRPTLD